MQELTDTGLHNFFCLFLSLAITADTEDIVSSFVDAKSSWNLKIKILEPLFINQNYLNGLGLSTVTDFKDVQVQWRGPG